MIPYTLQGFCHVTMAEHEQTLQKDVSGWTVLGEAFSGDLQAVSGMVKQLRSPRIQYWGLDPSVGWEILEKNKKIWSSGKPPVINELRPELCFQTFSHFPKHCHGRCSGKGVGDGWDQSSIWIHPLNVPRNARPLKIFCICVIKAGLVCYGSQPGL